MEKEKIYKRYFTLHEPNEDDRVYIDDEIIEIIRNNGNFMVVSDGGNGKSFISKKWAEILNEDGYRRIIAQNIDLTKLNEQIKDKTIIDNLDEINIGDAKKVISHISQMAINNVIVFSRPESVVNDKNPLFRKISFKNERNVNPRYEQYGAKEDLFNDLNKYFTETASISRVEREFLSLLSFKLLSIGRIDIYKEDLYEFVRIFNFNNSSTVDIEDLKKRDIFEFSNDDEFVFFKSKTIAAFFSIFFFKKFAHIKNSYLSYFNSFYSQAPFVETGTMLKKMGEQGKKLAWNMIKNNDFVFPFIHFYKETDGLDEIFKYGSKIELKDEFTLVAARTQTFISNDEAFGGSFYFSDYEAEIWKSMDFKKYFNIMQTSIKDAQSLQRVNFLFLNWAKHALIKTKNLKDYKDVKILAKELKNQSWIGERKSRSWNILGFAWEIHAVDKILKDDYINYIGPVESTLRFFITFGLVDKFIELLNKVGYKKVNYFTFDYSNDTKVLEEFIFSIYEKGWKEEFIRVWINLNADEFLNERVLEKIGEREFVELICYWYNRKKSRDGRFAFASDKYKKIMSSTKSLEEGNSVWFAIREVTVPPVLETIPIDVLSLKNNLKNFNIEPYIDKINSNRPNKTKLINFYCDFKIPESFLNNILDKIKKKFEDREMDNDYLTWWADPFLQVISKFKTITKNDIHPAMMLFLNTLDREDKTHWSLDITSSERKEMIISRFSQISNFEQAVRDHDSIHLREFIFDILNNMDVNDRNTAIGLIFEYSSSIDSWSELYLRYNNLENSKLAISRFNWEPKNLYEFFADTNKSELYKYKGNLPKTLIESMVKDLLNSMFTPFKKEKKEFYTVEWYDHFFFGHHSDIYDDRLINLLFENKMIDWYIPLYTKKSIEWLEKYGDLSICYQIIQHLYKLTYLLSQASAKTMINDFLASVPMNQIENAKRAWYSISKAFPEGQKELNINELYRYLNDDLNQVEFYSLFEREIVPIIDDIAKNTFVKFGLKTTETQIHEKINEILPEILIRKYSIIYQPESNPFVPKEAKKRIDFILTKNSKAIIVELKTTRSIGKNGDFSKQLSNYSQNKIFPTTNCAIVFENDVIRKRRESTLRGITRSQGFNLIILKSISVLDKK